MARAKGGATKRTRGKNRSTKLTEWMKASTHMTYKDLKRNCVVRGMNFDEVINGSTPSLSGWLHHHMGDRIDTSLLDKFDDYIEEQLKTNGKDELIHPQLRLGYIGERDEEGKVVKRKRIKGIKKRKKKRERTKDGIFQGTKKALTFTLQSEGLPIEEVIEKVVDTFPDANTKSIKIWYKKSRRLNG